MNQLEFYFVTMALVLSGLALVNLVVLVRSLRGYRTRQRMRCGGCGYDVSGLTELRCPECGGALREIGVASARVQRGFSTWFMALLLLAVSGILLWGVSICSWGYLGSRLPQSIFISDKSAGMGLSSNHLPVLEGDKPRERSRAVHIFYEWPEKSLNGRPLTGAYYPRAEEYSGMILVMREWGGRHHPPTNGQRVRPTWVPTGSMDDPILASEELALPYQVGDPLRLKDPGNVSYEEVRAWVESWDADWAIPERSSHGYEKEKTPEENVARVLLENIHSLASGGGISTSSPFGGAETGGFRNTGNVYVERAEWITQAFLWSIVVVAALVVGGIAAWAARRRRRMRSGMHGDRDPQGLAPS